MNFSFDDFLEAVEKIKNSKGEVPTRFVSPREYKLMERFWKEGKLQADGFPKPDYIEEYYRELKREIK